MEKIEQLEEEIKELREWLYENKGGENYYIDHDKRKWNHMLDPVDLILARIKRIKLNTNKLKIEQV